MTMAYVFLIGAVFCEVAGTMLLPVSQNFTRLWPTLGLAGFYLLAFYLLTFALGSLPIAIVYATWSGLGVFLIGVFSYFLFDQSLQWQAILGMALIIAGVALVTSFSEAH